jgi:iron complex outermembrane receptor protein
MDQSARSQNLNEPKLGKNPFVGNGSLSGKVIEKEKGEPLPGASVYIPDLKLGVVADSNGRYRFNTLPAGTYLVEVLSVGFNTFTENVVIDGATVVNFGLLDQFFEESPVAVTGLSKQRK